MADWQNNLNSFFDKAKEKEIREERPEFDQFVIDVVVPAFNQIAASLCEHGRFVNIRETDSSAALIVTHNSEEEIAYRIQGRMFPSGIMPLAEIRFKERKGRRLLTVESPVKGPRQGCTLADLTIDDITKHFVDNYTKRVEI